MSESIVEEQPDAEQRSREGPAANPVFYLLMWQEMEERERRLAQGDQAAEDK